MQANVFLFQAELSGTVFRDTNRNGRQDRGDSPLPGISLELVSQSSGEVIATARTNTQGRYTFDVQAGVRTDSYFVRLVAGPDGRPVTGQSRVVSVTRGDQAFRELNIGATLDTVTSQSSPLVSADVLSDSLSDRKWKNRK